MKLYPVQTNFTAGELSPRLYGRQDIDRYRNAVKVAENVFILVQGGMIRRYGMRYTAKAKHADKHTILVPYVFSRSQAYMLEFGDAFFRVFLEDGAQVISGGVPYEVATDYAEADLDEIDFVQSGDTMFLFHGDYRTRRIRRFGDASWVIDDVPWVTAPFAEIGFRPAADITVDSLALGPGRTVTASASVFMASDVDRQIQTEGGLATITGVTSGTVATVDALTPFPALTVPAGEWVLTGSPMTQLTPTYSGTDLPPVGASVTLTLAAAGWRAGDVGSWVEFNDGLVQITAVTSSTVATAVVLTAPASLVAVPALAWLLESEVWSDADGYPRTGTFFEQRLYCASSRSYPLTVWGSRIGEHLDFELGTDSDSAVSLSIASDQQNQITHLTHMGALVTLGVGGEGTISGTDDSAIAANVKNKIKDQSDFGCSIASPVRVAKEMMFIQRARRKVRALSADKIDSDQYGAPDITVLAEHITKPGIVGLAYQQEPDALLFALRADGVVATCTIDREQDVIGWCRQITQGQVDAIAVLPSGDGDQVWAIVIREVDGEQVRYIERYDPACFTDSAISGTSDTPKATWTGLDHLEGCTVQVLADGVAMNDQVVSGGSITLERTALAVEIGLGFVPRIEMLRPEVNGVDGSSQLAAMSVSSIGLRFLETTGALVNGQMIFARELGEAVIGTPPPLFTGDKIIETLGWDIGNFRCVIEQPQPYPFHLQMVVTTLSVNKG